MSPRLQLFRSSQASSDKRRPGHNGKLVPFALQFTVLERSRLQFHDRPRFLMILCVGAASLAVFAMLIPLAVLIFEGRRQIGFEHQLLFAVGLVALCVVGGYQLWHKRTGKWVVLESGEAKAAVFPPGKLSDPDAIGSAMKPITVELWTCSVFGYYSRARVRASSKKNYHAVVINHPDRIVIVCALIDKALAEDCANRLATRCGTEVFVQPYHQEIWGREFFGFNTDGPELSKLRAL